MKVAIVPARNEAKTIGNVLIALVRSECFDEIIVVSDGSTDETATIARNLGVTVIKHSSPTGKASALQTGVSATKAEILFFCDADLLGLKPKHIQNLVKAFDRHHFGMIVALRDRGSLLTKLSAGMPLISGERILHRKIFDQTPEQCKKGYQIELGLNATARHLGYGIGTVKFRGVTFRKKYQKVGIRRGAIEYITMIGQLIRAWFAINFLVWRHH